MKTFKHGDRVTCEIKGRKIIDARISIDESGAPFICQNEYDGSDAEDKLGYKYSWGLFRDFTNPFVTNLSLAFKTLDDIEVGDVLLNSDGDERPVLMRNGQVVVLGYKQSYGYDASLPKTIDELKRQGYTIKQDTPEPIKMTVAEVAEKLGHKVEIVEDKK